PGPASTADADELARTPCRHRLLGVLVEVDGDADEACAIAQLIPAGIPQLWHGYGERTWEVISAGAAAGHDVRVGLEDTLVLPDGRAASDNAELVGAAVALVGALEVSVARWTDAGRSHRVRSAPSSGPPQRVRAVIAIDSL